MCLINKCWLLLTDAGFCRLKKNFKKRFQNIFNCQFFLICSHKLCDKARIQQNKVNHFLQWMTKWNFISIFVWYLWKLSVDISQYALSVGILVVSGLALFFALFFISPYILPSNFALALALCFALKTRANQRARARAKFEGKIYEEMKKRAK